MKSGLTSCVASLRAELGPERDMNVELNLQAKGRKISMRILRLIVIPLAVFGLTANECTSAEEEILADEEDVNVLVHKINRSTDPVHIFARTEDFPCCRIEPGDDEDSVVSVREGDRVEFSAGRNGARFTTVTCTVSGGLLDEFPAPDATVELGFDETLRCNGW